MKKILLNTLKVLVVLALVALCGCRIYENKWLYDQPKFHDVTIELGQEIPAIDAFLTEYADPTRVSMVTPEIDPDLVGQQTLTFRHISKEEQVTLTIQDTVAPTAKFNDITAVLGQELHPEDFVSEVYDLAETSVAFAVTPAEPESYGNYTVELVVSDVNGNAITQQCHVFYVWMHESFSMELGDQAEPADLLLAPDKDAHLLDQAALDALNASPVGTYTVTTTDGGQSCSCQVTIVDTTAPTLVLKNVSFYLGGTATLEDFVVSATDLSGDVTLELLTQIDFEVGGVQTVQISATDASGNVTVEEATLEILLDTTPPQMYGLGDMYVAKFADVDYYAGVSAYDIIDGYVTFTVDASRVNVKQQGTYYAIYTTWDESGNSASFWRRVVVAHDSSDTDALVKSIAATLPADAEVIRDYVRDNIWYSSSYGGGDPVWFGFTEWHGNCYVHAKTFQVLLTEKGFTSRLIWVTDQSHYWLQVYLNGKWVHMDATPSTRHGKYSIMNDEQRYETLSGRDWDRSQWPKCE